MLLIIYCFIILAMIVYTLYLRGRVIYSCDQELARKTKTIEHMKKYLKLYGNDRKVLMNNFKKADSLLLYYIDIFKTIDFHAEQGLNNPLTTTTKELRIIREIILKTKKGRFYA